MGIGLGLMCDEFHGVFLLHFHISRLGVWWLIDVGCLVIQLKLYKLSRVVLGGGHRGAYERERGRRACFPGYDLSCPRPATTPFLSFLCVLF